MINIPSKATLYNRIITSLQTVFGITIPEWGANFLRAMSLVFAGEFKLQYLAIGNLQKNIFIDTADGDVVLRMGFVKLGRYPFAATQGQYTCTVTGTVGATIPAQTTFKSDDSSMNPGYLFILNNDFTLTSSPDSIVLNALTAGTVSRLSVGDTLTSTSPLVNVSNTATVSAEDIVPNAAETIEQYRAKALASFQLTPSGDNAVTYREEGSINISGVQQIYPYATSGESNEIDIYIEATPDDSTDGHGTPTVTITNDVIAAIEAARPLGVFEVNYYPITLKEFIVEINMTGYPALTADQEALILTSVTLFTASVRPFIAAADTLVSRNDTISYYNLLPAISSAIPGVPYGAVSFTIDGTPTTTYNFDNGEIPYLDSINYV